MIFKIDGVDMPVPSEMVLGIQDISKAQRNARGTMIIERIATKDKVEFVWSYLNQADLSKLLKAVQPVLFTVTYMDPETNTSRTGTFYAGDRTVGVLDYRGSVVRYKDIKFSVVER